MDSAMSNEKGFISEPTPGVAANPGDADATLPAAKTQVGAVALEIDKNDDPGGDPYNHTGSYCILEFGDN